LPNRGLSHSPWIARPVEEKTTALAGAEVVVDDDLVALRDQRSTRSEPTKPAPPVTTASMV
jgi:hypothetical protein